MPLPESALPPRGPGPGRGGTRDRPPGAAELAALSMPELRALAGLREGLAALDERVGAARLALYRDYVGATVSQVSPLLLRWCALESVDLGRLVLDLRPDRAWIGWLCGPRPSPGTGRSRVAALPPPAGKGLALDALHRFAFPGIAVGGGTPAVFGIRVLHRRLEFACFPGGGARLRTVGVGGSIIVPGELPATLVAALPGRYLDRLVGHPLLDDAGCVVREVRGPTRRGTEILFAVPPSAWTMPWAGG